MKRLFGFAGRPHALICCGVLLASLSLTIQAQSVLNFPRISFERNTFTGIAIANPTPSDAGVSLTAYRPDGGLVSGAGIQNPAQLLIPAGQQISRLLVELFGSAVPPETLGWVQATSPVAGLTGFFVHLDNADTFFDGADLPLAATGLVFNEIRLDPSFTTELNVFNPGDTTATVLLRLVARAGSPLVERSVTLPAKGMARLDAADFFGVSTAPPGAYVTASSDTEVAGFEFVRSLGGDLLGLNARSATEQLVTLFFPQMAVLGPWTTELGLVNYAASPAIVTVTAFQPDGTLYGTSQLRNNPVTLQLAGGASLREDVAALFGFGGGNALDGWLKVESTSPAINGQVSYGANRSLAAVATAAEGLTRTLFSHIATAQGFFNGVAVLNPGNLAANIRIVALRPNGSVLGSFGTVLRPGQRLSNLIDNLIPQAAGQAGGLIWVKSDQPVYAIELFGTANTLANVPAQPAPDSYQPDSALPALRLIPPLAPIQVGGSQVFQLQNSTGAVLWSVNDVRGGDATNGSISAAGQYRAPARVPAPQAVVVAAESSTQINGATVDILQKETLISGLGLVQSVAYIDSLNKLYVAELAAVSGSKPAATAGATEIFEVSTSAPKIQVASYTGETIAKMIPFTASDGKSYLLLAAQTTGRVIRLDPGSRESVNVATGLNQPSALVIDPASGDLLVAEVDKISSVARTLLERPAGKGAPDQGDRAVSLFAASAPAGIAVDACSGDIFFSERATAAVRKFIKSTGQTVTVASLSSPGQMLAVYRSGVSCPFSLQLLVLERGLDRVALIYSAASPEAGAGKENVLEKSAVAGGPGVLTHRPAPSIFYSLVSWLPVQAATDLAAVFGPGALGNFVRPVAGVLIPETVGVASSILSAVRTASEVADVLNLYGTKPPNPAPPAAPCAFTISRGNFTFGSSGGVGQVRVSTASHCNWLASSNAAWITVTGGAVVGGTGTTSFRVEANSGTTRTGTLTIAGNTVTVTQEGQVAAVWTATGPAGERVLALAIDPQNPAILYAGIDGNGVFKTTDAAASWNPVHNGFLASSGISLGINPQSPVSVYSGTDGGGIFRTINAGNSWSAVNDGLTNLRVTAVAVDPQSQVTVYAGTPGGMFKTTNAAATWDPINSGLTNTNIVAFGIHPTTPQLLYAGTSTGGVFKSVNGGASWSAASSGLASLAVRSLALDPKSTQTLYAGTASGVFKSVNAGSSWTAAGAGIPAGTAVAALAIDPQNSNIVYAGTTGRGVYRSVDGGQTWTEFSGGLSNQDVTSLAIDPRTPSTLYAGTNGAGVFKGSSSLP